MANVYGVDRTAPRPTITYAVIASTLGAIALVAGIMTLFTGGEPFLVIVILVLWAMATVRHRFVCWMRRASEDEASPIARAA
jgi:Na+-transporting methylmalonyl-CoA/oxaloacetate decarboxylase gamma subunit